ncbi:acetolactate decarboxylase [Pseudodesulfovibrio cashew]|uniref:Alpha-acetolactate decarboxylase n=1 Tax=Pseudodesulfovibrio cashew TaxID=2678688 RepID=A0A6I6JHM5_9BACT|nr:acetolactate decarboxylase [Pseudodesulfovibrio cashew]QGY40530.1 acetolactate decarboxylase [Pseudodesulfovibrio cashew]
MTHRRTAILRSALVYFLLVFFCCPPVYADDSSVLFQIGNGNSLLAGAFDGSFTCAELLEHGDLGIGTFAGFDGEMVISGDSVYQIRSDGSVHVMLPQATTPFAMATFFKADLRLTLTNVTSREDFIQRLQQKLPAKNLFYAIKATGFFEHIKTRSIPKQQKPYPPLAEVVKTQPEFVYDHTEGSIMGFYCPEITKSIAVPGFHFHFLSKDKDGGGHLLELQAKTIIVELDTISRMYLVLPTDAFAQ